MAIKKKKIEFFQVSMISLNGDKEVDVKFEDVLSSKDVIGKDVYIKGKDLELKVYKNDSNILVGLLETSRSHNVPPKKSKIAKKLSKLGLNDDEGLAFGNVFLYDKKRKVLMYEVNKFGCYLDHFINFIYSALKQSESELYKKFKIKLDVVLTSNEYNRIINMDFHKSIEVQIAQPKKIISDLKHKNGALFNVCKSANELQSSRMFAKFEVEAKKESNGLLTKSIKEILSDITNLLKTKSSENIQKVIVTGYQNDVKSLQKIDLIANRYIKHIKLNEPRANLDLLEKQRSTEIRELHNNCTPELDEIFGI